MRIKAYEVFARALEEGARHAARRLIEERETEDLGIAADIIENEVSLAVDAVVEWDLDA